MNITGRTIFLPLRFLQAPFLNQATTYAPTTMIDDTLMRAVSATRSAGSNSSREHKSRWRRHRTQDAHTDLRLQTVNGQPGITSIDIPLPANVNALHAPRHWQNSRSLSRLIVRPLIRWQQRKSAPSCRQPTNDEPYTAAVAQSRSWLPAAQRGTPPKGNAGPRGRSRRNATRQDATHPASSR